MAGSAYALPRGARSPEQISCNYLRRVDDKYGLIGDNGGVTRNAVIYCRISKDANRLGLGVQRQERECRELAEREGFAIVEVLVDNDLSGYSGKRRPGYLRMFELLEEGRANVVVAVRQDRLTRNLTQLSELVAVLQRTRSTLHLVQAGPVDLSTAAGQLQANVVGSVAQYESQVRGERIASKAAELARNGRPPGGPPAYGYRRERPDSEGHKGGWVPDEHEAPVVVWMLDEVLAGRSLLSVSRELNDRQIPTRRGKPWHHSVVRTIICNPAIVGLRVHVPKTADSRRERTVIGEASWEPIVDRAKWEQVVQVLTDPLRKRKTAATRHLLTGLLVTPGGDHMRGATVRRQASERRIYTTSTGASVAAVADSADLEAIVVEACLLRADTEALATAEPIADAGEVELVEAELTELAKLRGDGVISLAEWLAAREPIERRLSAARERLGATFVRPPVVLTERGALREAWPNLSFERRREVLAAMIEAVTVTPSGRNRYSPLGGRVAIRWRV